MKSYGLERTGPKRENTCSTILPANEYRTRALELVSQIEPFVWELSKVLFKIKDEQLYMVGEVTYPSFDSYIEGELSYSPRRGRYLASIYDKFTQANIGGDIVNELGSSKSRLLARVVDSANAEVWIEKAKNTTYVELENEIRSEQQGKVVQGHSLGSINIPYYNGETRIAWLEAVELASKLTGCNSKESVLEALVAEFLSTYSINGTHDMDEQSKQIAEYEILSRAGWRCEVAECGKRVSLQVHHIIFRSHAPELKDDPKNKIVLCQNCHNEIHRHGAELIKIQGKWALKKR